MPISVVTVGIKQNIRSSGLGHSGNKNITMMKDAVLNVNFLVQ